MSALEPNLRDRMPPVADSAKVVVAIKALHKRFDVSGPWPWSPRRSVAAVIDVNLEVREGEVVALVGQSGSGKTTLSRVILGLESPTEGEVWIESRRWDNLVERDRQALRLAYQYIPQDAMSALDPQQTVIEAVRETLTVLAKCPRAEAQQRASEMLGRLGLSHRHDALPRQLSGGEQRRVTLARVLALAPRLVVADEPTSGLDPDRRAAVLEDLVGNLPPGAGCILVTHDLDAAIPYCHRVVVMLEGRVVEVGDLRHEPAKHPYTRSLLDPWHDPGGAA